MVGVSVGPAPFCCKKFFRNAQHNLFALLLGFLLRVAAFSGELSFFRKRPGNMQIKYNFDFIF